MKRIFFLFAIALGVSFLALFTSSVSSSAGGQKRNLRQSNTQTAKPESRKPGESRQPENSKQANTEEEFEADEDDPDLPPGVKGLNKQAYLQRREQYIGLRRGIELGRPFDPGARGRAIAQMQVQEALQSAKAKLTQSQAAAGYFRLAPTVLPLWTTAAFGNDRRTQPSDHSGPISTMLR